MSDLYLYADDAKLLKHILHETDCTTLQADLYNMSSWMDRWLLKLNEDKCKVVSYSRNILNNANYNLKNKVY